MCGVFDRVLNTPVNLIYLNTRRIMNKPIPYILFWLFLDKHKQVSQNRRAKLTTIKAYLSSISVQCYHFIPPCPTPPPPCPTPPPPPPPLKTQETQTFSGVFRMYKMETWFKNGFMFWTCSKLTIQTSEPEMYLESNRISMMKHFCEIHRRCSTGS